jgi:hypothetical protein
LRAAHGRIGRPAGDGFERDREPVGEQGFEIHDRPIDGTG